MKRFGICLSLVMLMTVACQAAAQQAEVEIAVTSEGSATIIDGDIARAEDEAVNAAKRNAVELGVGVLVRSETLGRDFSELSQIILTRSEGFISSWQKIEGSRRIESIEGSKLVSIKITAKVKALNLADALSDIEWVYESMRRPKIMVLITERNIGRVSDALPASALAVMSELREMKFDVVDPEVVKRLVSEKSTQGAPHNWDAKAAARLAQQSGAEILVLGSSESFEQAPPEGAERLKLASAILRARIIYPDSGEVLYTSKQIDGRGVSTSSVQDAGIKALDAAGRKLISTDSTGFAAQLVARWASELQNGRMR